MSHQIKSKDTCVVSDGKTWHKLGVHVPDINYENSGLDWTVEKRQVVLDGGPKIEGYEAVYSPEKDEVISVMKESYALIQNSQVFEIVEQGLDGVEHRFISAGSLGQCKRIYLTVEIVGESKYTANGEEFSNYLNFISGHDGSLSLMGYDSSFRIVCSNSLAMSLAAKGGLMDIKVRHSKNNGVKIEKMTQELDRLFLKREEFYSDYRRLTEQAMSLEEAEKIILGFVAADDVSTRAINKTSEILHLFQKGAGNKGETKADLLNSYTEYATHFSSKDPNKNYASSEFGSARDKKSEFFQIVRSDEKLKALARRGELLLAGV